MNVSKYLICAKYELLIMIMMIIHIVNFFVKDARNSGHTPRDAAFEVLSIFRTTLRMLPR